jgi:hypothetical protein
MDFRQFVPVEALQGNSRELSSYYAPLGDYIGGVIGTLIGAATLLVVLRTWRNDSYKGRREKAYESVFELLRAHDAIVQGIQPLKRKPETDPFGGIHHEFNEIYKLITASQSGLKSLSLNEKVGIAYIYTYFGPYTEALELSSLHYGKDIAQSLHKAVQQKRNAAGPKGYLAGHQQILSHYFRNLYTVYRFISESGLSGRDKRLLARITRSRLSNYEQALLVLNAVSPLGRAWKETGLMRRFQPVSNVPRLFFGFDPEFNLQKAFPYIRFEWEEYYPQNPNAWKLAFDKAKQLACKSSRFSCSLLARGAKSIRRLCRRLIHYHDSPEPPL